MARTLVRIAGLVASLAAGPLQSAQRDSELFIRPEDQHTVLFGSLDAGRSVFVSGGSKQTLTGPLDREGVVALESTGFGLTRERAGTIRIDRLKHESAALLGYQVSNGPVYVAAYAGPEVQEEQLAIGGRLRRFSQPRPGLRGQAELWANPTPDTLLTATVVAGSARSSLWARAAAGAKVWTDTYLGPEVTVYTTPTYREVRVGAHLTGPPVGPVNLRLSAGWLTDDAHRGGSPYLGISAWIRL